MHGSAPSSGRPSTAYDLVSQTMAEGTANRSTSAESTPRRVASSLSTTPPNHRAANSASLQLPCAPSSSHRSSSGRSGGTLKRTSGRAFILPVSGPRSSTPRPAPRPRAPDARRGAGAGTRRHAEASRATRVGSASRATVIRECAEPTAQTSCELHALLFSAAPHNARPPHATRRRDTHSTYSYLLLTSVTQDTVSGATEHLRGQSLNICDVPLLRLGALSTRGLTDAFVAGPCTVLKTQRLAGAAAAPSCSASGGSTCASTPPLR